jgi:glycine/D-amino acid oxidase-like deaminating enzyme
MDIDFLIIGQGLAGSLLAWELIKRECKVVIIDNANENASLVAAGLINPITGLRFAKSADVDSLLPAAIQYYAKLAHFFQRDFFLEKPMLRIFRSEAEIKNCKKRLFQSSYKPYLGKLSESSDLINNLATPFGFLEQKQTGYLLTRPLIMSLREFFIACGCYRQLEFDYQAIQWNPVLHWQDLNPQQIIFCEGYHALNNPWFSWLPLQPAKGEILTLQHSSDLPDKMLNFGNWLIPLTDQRLRIGASFERDCFDTGTTNRARDALLNSLKQIAPSVEATLLSQQAGIRPCTQDRQPFIGKHLKYPQLAIFNGFGAKGSLQIPWYVQHFADVLLQNTTLLTSSDIRRHEAYFTDSTSSFAD